VIATRDDAAVVRSRVANLLETSYPGDRMQVVVALDSNRPPGAGSVDYDDARVHVVAGREPGGKAVTLNAGVQVSAGEVLVFTDAHQRFRETTIPALVAALSPESVGLTTGRLEIPQGATLARLYWRYERWLRRWESAVHSTVGATGAVYALRRDDWVDLPAHVILDDVFTPMAIVMGGKRVRFVEDATAIETRSVSMDQEYARKVRTLTGVLQLCAWLPATLSPRRNPIWLQFWIHKLLRLLTPYLLLMLGASLIGGLVVWSGSALRTLAVFGILVAGLILSRNTGPSRSLVKLVRELALIQAATVRAAINGARRSWSVWG